MSHVSSSAAEIYLCLAEIFGQTSAQHTPGWMLRPGAEWPLLTAAAALEKQRPSLALREAVRAISGVGASSADEIQAQYHSLFSGNGRPPIWLHESYYVDGRIPGPSTFAVKKLYADAGVSPGGAELPDHASLEWAFLSYLAEKGEQDLHDRDIWRSAERLFIKNHLLRWFPDVARALAASAYPAWAAVGRFCAALLNGDQGKSAPPASRIALPEITDAGACTLCGFCVQACPDQALKIHEDAGTTALWLSPEACSGCRKCLRVCPQSVLALSGVFDGPDEILLRESPRSACPGCGKPTVSEAELAHVASRIGNPEWLAYCLDCRQHL